MIRTLEIFGTNHPDKRNLMPLARNNKSALCKRSLIQGQDERKRVEDQFWTPLGWSSHTIAFALVTLHICFLVIQHEGTRTQEYSDAIHKGNKLDQIWWFQFKHVLLSDVRPELRQGFCCFKCFRMTTKMKPRRVSVGCLWVYFRIA